MYDNVMFVDNKGKFDKICMFDVFKIFLFSYKCPICFINTLVLAGYFDEPGTK